MGESGAIKSVLVTGGCGFLGAAIVRQLLDTPEGSPTAVAVVSRNASSSQHRDSRVTYHSADIANEEQVRSLFDKIKPEVVIHAASPSNSDWPNVLQRTNVFGTQVLLQCAAACPATRALVYTSSDSAIEPTTDLLTEENAKLYDDHHYHYHYGRTKAIAETLVLAANSAELRTTALRLPVVYGEGDRNFAPQLLESVRKNEHKMQLGSNKKLFEFIYVQKAAEAHVLAAKALLRTSAGPKVDGEAFFITDGKPMPFFDFFRKACAAAGHPVAPEQVTTVPFWFVQFMASAGEWTYWIFTLGTKRPKLLRQNIDHLDYGCHWSIEKAKERLGYSPVEDQDEAIKRSMDWAVENVK
jgi:sterol-4alpha-carboxylate 3-dehydrogenase (decarboxylating)